VIRTIFLDEYEKLPLEQWIRLYGIVSNRSDYIITCQVYQLKAVLGSIRRHWWDDFTLELINEDEQPMSIEEVFSNSGDR
jgi:hypothetical protein